MAAKMYLGFEEKYLSKHFESEYVAYHNNLKLLGELQRKLLPSHYASIRMPRKWFVSYFSPSARMPTESPPFRVPMPFYDLEIQDEP